MVKHRLTDLEDREILVLYIYIYPKQCTNLHFKRLTNGLSVRVLLVFDNSLQYL